MRYIIGLGWLALAGCAAVNSSPPATLNPFGEDREVAYGRCVLAGLWPPECPAVERESDWPSEREYFDGFLALYKQCLFEPRSRPEMRQCVFALERYRSFRGCIGEFARLAAFHLRRVLAAPWYVNRLVATPVVTTVR
ncbi:MAG: hypothetical protein HYV42_00930 [Candidatus Magasanikbacteria bacterium]|nr:hypothetical protein [Candidatus Magasanikbacteria bacterium]